MPTATIPTSAPRLASLTRVDVLDFGPMRDEAVAHYISLDKNREEWPEDKKKRLVISTESKWGRVQLENDQVYMLSEKGEGPRKPLSDKVTCRVALFAAMNPGHGEEGWFESKSFAQVEIDDVHARGLPTIGGIDLEDFIKSRVPEYEASYNEWRELLRTARQKIQDRRAKNKTHQAPTTTIEQPAEDVAPPAVAEGAPPVRKPPGGGRIKL